MSDTASKNNSDKHLDILMIKKQLNGAAIALADYSLDLINYQKDKGFIKRMFGSYSKGTSGFKQVVWGFENGKYGVPTFLNHIYYAYQKADDEEQELFGTESKIKQGLLHMFKVYAKECTLVLDDWIEKNSETLFPGDDPEWVLETIKDASKNENARYLSEYLFNNTLEYFYGDKDPNDGLKELSKGYAKWKKNLKKNILIDDCEDDIIDLLNEKWKKRTTETGAQEKNDKKEMSIKEKRAQKHKQKLKESQPEDEQDMENSEVPKNNEKTFTSLGFKNNVNLIADTIKNVKDDVDRKIIQTFKSKCPMKFVVGKK